MITPKMPVVSAKALTCGLLFAGASFLSGAENKIMPLTEGHSWSLPLPGNATLDLAWIPPGTFTMGSPATEPGRASDEDPSTRVTLTKGFWLGKTHVTIGQWKSVMGVGVRAQLVKAINDDTLYDLDGKKQTLRDLMKWSREADPAAYLGPCIL